MSFSQLQHLSPSLPFSDCPRCGWQMSYELRQWTPHNRVSLLEDRGGQRDRYERSGGGGERGYHDYRQYKRERTASLPRAERSREHERERERSRERSGDPAGYRSRSQGVALAAAAQQHQQHHHHDSHFYPDSPPMRTPSPASSRPRQSQRSRSQVQQFHNASFSSANDAPEYRSPTTTLSFHNTSSESATNRASYDPAERAAQQQQQQQRPSWREGLARAKEQSRSIGDAYSREERGGGGGGGGDVWRAGNGASGTAGGRSAHVEQLLAQLRQERAQGKKLRDGGGAGAGAGGDRRRRSLPTSDARASSAVGASVEPPLGRPPRSASTPRSLPREDAEPTRAASAALPPAAGGGGGGASYAQGKRSPGLSQAEYERLRRRNKEWQEDLQRRRDRCGSRGGAGSGSGGGGGGGGEAGGDAAEAIASRYAAGERGAPWVPDLAPSKSSGSTAPTEAQSQLGDTTGGMWKVVVKQGESSSAPLVYRMHPTDSYLKVKQHLEEGVGVGVADQILLCDGAAVEDAFCISDTRLNCAALEFPPSVTEPTLTLVLANANAKGGGGGSSSLPTTKSHLRAPSSDYCKADDDILDLKSSTEMPSFVPSSKPTNGLVLNTPGATAQAQGAALGRRRSSEPVSCEPSEVDASEAPPSLDPPAVDFTLDDGEWHGTLATNEGPALVSWKSIKITDGGYTGVQSIEAPSGSVVKTPISISISAATKNKKKALDVNTPSGTQIAKFEYVSHCELTGCMRCGHSKGPCLMHSGPPFTKTNKGGQAQKKATGVVMMFIPFVIMALALSLAWEDATQETTAAGSWSVADVVASNWVYLAALLVGVLILQLVIFAPAKMLSSLKVLAAVLVTGVAFVLKHTRLLMGTVIKRFAMLLLGE